MGQVTIAVCTVHIYRSRSTNGAYRFEEFRGGHVHRVIIGKRAYHAEKWREGLSHRVSNQCFPARVLRKPGHRRRGTNISSKAVHVCATVEHRSNHTPEHSNAQKLRLLSNVQLR